MSVSARDSDTEIRLIGNPRRTFNVHARGAVADSSGVQAGAAFADILGSKLRDFGGEPPFASAASNSRPITPPLFLLTDPQVHFHSTPYAAMGGGAAAPQPQPRRPRKLTVAERIALARLNALGAALADDMSVADLRSAYRRLARDYHPDRHPSSASGEQERLSRLFGEITAHYRRLAAALDRERTATVH
jgi:hypothetical protein